MAALPLWVKPNHADPADGMTSYAAREATQVLAPNVYGTRYKLMHMTDRYDISPRKVIHDSRLLSTYNQQNDGSEQWELGLGIEGPWVLPTETDMQVFSDWERTTSAGTLTMQRSDESIVLFCNTSSATVNVQTGQMADRLRESQSSNTTELYHLVNVNGTPILPLRLWPGGYFTTSKVASWTWVGNYIREFELRFIQYLPPNQPIPANPSMGKLLRRMTKHSLRGETYSVTDE
jgi:hypothetical protein